MTAFWVAMCSMVFFLYMEKGWSFKLLATPWYRQQNLLMRLVTMQVGISFVSTVPCSQMLKVFMMTALC
jgi:hypothetical protein